MVILKKIMIMMTQKNSPDLDASMAGGVRNDETREAAGRRGVLKMRVCC